MEQTNRTILFERLNEKSDSLISLIEGYNNRESLSDDEMKMIRSKLEVSSFHEVIQKFQPVLYLYLNTENQIVEIEKEISTKNGMEYKEIILCQEESFIPKLIQLMEYKKNSQYVMDSFQEICESMLQTKKSDEFLMWRRDLFSLVQNEDYEAAEQLLKQIITKYDDSIFLLKNFLNGMKDIVLNQQDKTNGKRYIIDLEQAEVSPIAISDRFKRFRNVTRIEEEAYHTFIEKSLDTCSIHNRHLMGLLLQLECGVNEHQTKPYMDEYNKQLVFYKHIFQKLWWSSKPIFETLMGIKAFFDQYDDISGVMPPTLLIANETVQNLCMGKNKNLLRLYLESANEKSFTEDVIWYAIIPRIAFQDRDRKPIRQRFQAETYEYEYHSNEEDDVFELVHLLSKYKIHSFVSVTATAQSTFAAFQEKGMEIWDFAFAFLNKLEEKEYICPCYPNFSLIPKAATLSNIGVRLQYDSIRNRINVIEDVKMWFDDLNVEASYIAAGLFAAIQCPTYLSHFFPKKTSPELPGVAYRMCVDGHGAQTTTQMCHEVIGYSDELKAQIEKKSRGIVFAPARDKVYVMTDRVLSYSQIKPDTLSIIQTVTYIERVIRNRSQDFKANLIKEFFEERPDSLIFRWKRDGEHVNSLIKRGESIGYSIDPKSNYCNIMLQFSEITKDKKIEIQK